MYRGMPAMVLARKKFVGINLFCYHVDPGVMWDFPPTQGINSGP